MGEVYRAKDTRLDRDVAIKVLPEHLSSNPDLRTRFEREARAVSSLNHPHICVLHDVGHQDGTDYIVMELVEGETLLDRLKKGPLPLEQTLRYGIEIADALDKAHRHGVIHRDLKPGNIMLTKAGSKLMDFGLAKRGAAGDGGGVSTLPTREKPLTEAGSLLGTYQYMSPEQLEGKDADARSDIWALGCVLYEMATGKRAFEGKSQASLISAILTSEPPPIAQLQPMAPPALDRLVKVCLAKDPDERLQAAHDVMQALKWIAEYQHEVVTTAPRRPRLFTLALTAIAAALLGAGLVRLGHGRANDRAQPSQRVAEVVRFTHEAGLFESPTWSPDGKLVAFASNHSGNFEIYVRRADGGQEVNVTANPAEDFQPAFSPDGRSIAFVSTRSSRTGVIPVGGLFGLDYRAFGGDLWIAPALGGSARRLAQDANYPTWRPDGRAILYVSGSEDHRSLREVSPDGTPLHDVLASGDSSWEVIRPHYSPDVLWISFENAGGKIFLMPANGGRPHELLVAAGHAWADNGSLFFLRKGAAGGTLIGRVAVDRRSGLAAGPEQVVGVLTGTISDVAVAPGSHALAVSELEAGFNLTRLPLSSDGSRPAGPEEALTSGSVRDRYPAYSFDGRRLAYSTDRAGPQAVWVLDLKTMHQERLPVPQDDLESYSPNWLPDGHTVVVARSKIAGPGSLWLLSLDGSRSEQLPLSREIPLVPGAMGVSPDGHRVLVPHPDGSDIQLYDLDLVTRTERRLTTTPGNKYDGIWSRDGRQIAYLAGTAGTLQLWTQPAAGGEARQLTFGAERMRHASFSPDGQWIYVQPSHRNIWRVPAAGGPLEQVTTFPESGLFLEEPTLSPDGHALAYARWKGAPRSGC